MRTTVTLDADTEARLRQRMAEHGIGFKRALNDALRAGLGLTSSPFETRPTAMGIPVINLDRALQVAADLEDDELVQRMRRGG